MSETMEKCITSTPFLQFFWKVIKKMDTGDLQSNKWIIHSYWYISIEKFTV